MSNETFEQNLDTLKQRFPKLVPFVRQAELGLSELFMSKKAQPSLAYKGVLLHSKYDPAKEALGFAAGSGVSKGDQVLLYGLGLAYHVQALAKSIGARGELCVIEANPHIVRRAFESVDLRELLQNPQVSFVFASDEQELAQRLNVDALEPMQGYSPMRQKIVVHKPSLECMPKKFARLANFFEVLYLEKQVPASFQKIDRRNFLSNLDVLLTSAGVTEVLPQMQDQPCFLIAAGPSLHKNLDFLKRMQDRAWLVAVDTALAILIDAGIKPDLAISVDPQDESARHFKNIWHEDVPLIVLPTSNAEVVQNYAGTKIVTLLKEHSLTRSIEDVFAYKGLSLGGGCAAGVMLDILISSMLNPIVLVGMDFAFPKMQLYCDGAKVTENWKGQTHKFKTLPMIHRAAIYEKKVLMVPNRHGEFLPTYQNLYSYLKTVEQIIDKAVNVSIYNLRSDGAMIAGTQDIVLEEQLELLVSKGTMSKRLEIPSHPFSEIKKRQLLERLALSESED